MDKIRVLLVDDETDFSEMIKMRLEANGYDVSLACNGDECLDAVRRDKPDVILLDVMMPGKDGYQTLRELRHDRGTYNIPVIMLTAKGESDSIMRAQNSGAADYLIKPVDSAMLLTMVARHAAMAREGTDNVIPTRPRDI